MYNKKEDESMEPINLGKLNNIARTAAKGKVDSFEERTRRVVNQLKEHAEREVCEFGPFKTVRVNASAVNPKDALQDLILQITPLPKSLKNEVANFEKLRYLELIGEGSMGQQESVILKRGTKKEILAKLNEEDFVNKVLEKAKEFRVSFIED